MKLVRIMFWPNLPRDFILLGSSLTPLVVLHLAGRDVEALRALMYGSWIVAAGFVSVLLVWKWRCPFLIYRRARDFHVLESPNCVLCYEPPLESVCNLPLLRDRCEHILADLTHRFAYGLSRQVAIFVFASHKNLSSTLRRPVHGLALIRANSIVVADETTIENSIRHELAHLFSAKWNLHVPRFFNEGVATYLQSESRSSFIDAMAADIIRQGAPGLCWFLGPAPVLFLPDSNRRSLYILGASFTGFLIRRFGWETFRKFFRRTHMFNVRSSFRKAFGFSLKDAERDWHQELGC